MRSQRTAWAALLIGLTISSAPGRTQVQVVPQIPHVQRVKSLAFSSDGLHVLSASQDSTVKLWSTRTGQLLRTFEGHVGSVNSAVFSPDGVHIASGGQDTTIRIWDVTTGALKRRFGEAKQIFWPLTSAGAASISEPITGIAYSPDGTKIVSSSWGDQGQLKLWDVASGVQIRSYEGHAGLVSFSRIFT